MKFYDEEGAVQVRKVNILKWHATISTLKLYDNIEIIYIIVIKIATFIVMIIVNFRIPLYTKHSILSNYGNR